MEVGLARYVPYGGVAKAIGCQDELVLVEGPAGTGKTRGLLEKGNFAAQKYPGARVLLVRETRVSMTESILKTFEEDVLPKGSPLKRGAKRAQRKAYTYPNGSVVACCGMDNADRIMSSEWDLILCFESTELSDDDVEKLSTRLRNGKMPYQQLMADCNPGAPTHFLNVWANEGRMTRCVTSHEDNPRWWDRELGEWTDDGLSYIGRLEALTGVRKERLRHGRWVQAEGIVYEFNERVHVVDPFPVPESWAKIRVIDFGYTNPFVCQWWAKDEDGRMYLYREFYRRGETVGEDHAPRINRLSGYEVYEATVADHDAEDRATLDSKGIPTVPAVKDVTRGIQMVEEQLATAGDGRPRLFIFRNATVDPDPGLAEDHLPTSTRMEFDGYVWPKGIDGKPVKEDPVKVNDHGMDCVRYAVVHWNGQGRLEVGSRPKAARPEVPVYANATRPVVKANKLRQEWEMAR